MMDKLQQFEAKKKRERENTVGSNKQGGLELVKTRPDTTARAETLLTERGSAATYISARADSAARATNSL